MGERNRTTCGSRHVRGQLIAIIDDDQSMQDSLQKLIESIGLVARCFGSGEEFLEYHLHREVGCLIAEIQMPGISGLELQAWLKEEQCNIPIIFITSNGGARMRIQAMREGAVEFLAKPLDDQQLLKAVRAALDL
jgi:FixJ family two-component response regulator